MKKIICLIASSALALAMFSGCTVTSENSKAPSTSGTDGAASVSGSNEEASPAETSSAPFFTGEVTDKGNADITLYSVMTTDPEFPAWLADVEAATGLKIHAVPAPTDSDTRQQKITTLLSSGDPSVDIFEINDEMASAFKNLGWFEPLETSVMTSDIMGQFPVGYVKDMITSKDGHVIGVPGYKGYLGFWVNGELLKKAGMETIATKEDFIKFCEAVSDGEVYGYGGAWEKTYSHCELGQFVNWFGGDYLDWTNPGNREAMEFLYKMVNEWKYTPKSQIGDKYEQLTPRILDGKVGCWLMWGTGGDYRDAEMYGPDKIHMIAMPTFETNKIFMDSWSYALSAGSESKEASVKFLQYVASVDGELSAWRNFDRYPARSDAEADPSVDGEIKDMYSNISKNNEAHGRPMLPMTMEYITDMGTLFQSYINDEINIDQFLEQAQKYVVAYS